MIFFWDYLHNSSEHFIKKSPTCFPPAKSTGRSETTELAEGVRPRILRLCRHLILATTFRLKVRRRIDTTRLSTPWKTSHAHASCEQRSQTETAIAIRNLGELCGLCYRPPPAGGDVLLFVANRLWSSAESKETITCEHYRAKAIRFGDTQIVLRHRWWGAKGPRDDVHVDGVRC